MAQGKHSNNFFTCNRGGLSVLFAIVMPFIICFCALTFDGSRLLMKRAKLADAINEATLAIATRTDPEKRLDPEEQKKNEEILHNYLNVYLPGTKIAEASIVTDRTVRDPSSGTDVIVFDVKAKIEVETILPLKHLPSFDPQIELSNGGSVRKGAYVPASGVDFLLLVDFSGSMDDDSAAWDQELNAYISRISLLKKVVKEIIDAGLDMHPDTTFGIVPWETGVPVKFDRSNVLGGDAVGCSALMVPNTPQNSNSTINFDIDYEFWGPHKYLSYHAPQDKEWQIEYLDYGRFAFFQYQIIPYLLNGWDTDTQWCTKYTPKKRITNVNGTLNPDHEWDYRCEFPYRTSIYSAAGQDIINRELNDYINVFEAEARHRQFPNGASGTNSSIFNSESMNIPETLKNMFTEDYVITMEVEVAQSSYASGGLNGFCGSLSDNDNTGGMATYKAPAYMIELTNDRNKLNAFQNMQPRGGTNSSVGLLRGVPVLAKGKNPRKVMIMITDGDDNEGGDEYLTELLHTEHNVCDKIRTGMIAHSPDTEQMDIYFISVKAESEDEERLAFWRTYCTGEGKAFIADNYDDLIHSFKKIMEINEETGYFYAG